MKILFLIHSLAAGGAERVTVNLANYWAAKGWSIVVATLDADGNDFYYLHSSVERISLGVSRESQGFVSAIANNVRSLRAVRRVLIEKHPDIAIGMMTTANVFLGLGGWGLPVTCIGSERVHPPMVPLGFCWEHLRTFGYARLQTVIALSEMSAEWLRRHTKARRIAVICNPVLWPLPSTEPTRDLEEMRRIGRQTLLAVGRLTEQKGFDLLLKAFSEIAEVLPNWDMVIVGEGLQREELEIQIQSLGLRERVVLPGRIGNMGDCYAAADIYVMSSRYEGFPNTLVEAMAHGLPAVSFDCPTGPIDIIRNEVDGLLVPYMDVTALALALTRLMRDEGLRVKMSQRSVDARERFSIDRIAGMWEQLFGELPVNNFETQVQRGERFEFGANWRRFLDILDENRILEAEQSLKNMLKVDNLHEKKFLDVGSGSGLFSLAARRLGAQVHSFDYDPQSVGCTKELKCRYFPDDADWIIEEASVLDGEYLGRLGQFDVVYSWGVLHHTGAMWEALANVASLVSDDGVLFVSIYNDQGGASKRWEILKRLYNRYVWLRMPLAVYTFFRQWALTFIKDLVSGNPLRSWHGYKKSRGMSAWHDVVDWIGGYPFEVARPEEVFHFFQDLGFVLLRLKTCAGGLGCNEYVFRKSSRAATK